MGLSRIKCNHYFNKSYLPDFIKGAFNTLLIYSGDKLSCSHPRKYE
ncbi:hypothetical protein XSR1_70036 [Xenorhabdus szentirmaii DSM 16338]|uniref:Uncharacterized protein n=1 Tax=Xenorhabdus szentirmaii DSM 16338 TaxID=1427518 RepID=W1J608_9GAMM|nr:hypothetical protein XSR1_70036 [Xenorhabdus szentirmaii DSM 16338]